MIYAEQRSDTTQFELGQMFSKAPDDTRDYEQAAQWFKLSAKKGNANAQYKIGLMYSTGLGVKIDYLRAYAWLKISAIQGSHKALHILKKLATKIPPGRQKQAHKMSRMYYEKYVVPFTPAR
jgi:TPR repeat protein